MNCEDAGIPKHRTFQEMEEKKLMLTHENSANIASK